MKEEWKKLGWFIGLFVIAYLLPLGSPKVREAIYEAFRLLQWYAREHTLACVVPALFIAGAITTFLSQASVVRYLGPKANKMLAYSVASVSGFGNTLKVIWVMAASVPHEPVRIFGIS